MNKTILAIISTFLGALVLFGGNQLKTATENLQMTQIEEEDLVGAYLQDITIVGTEAFWNLQNKQLNNELLESIAKSIERGMIQLWTNTPTITGIYIDASNNPEISYFRSVLNAIKTGGVPNIEAFELNLLGCTISNWDGQYSGYTLPTSLKTFTFKTDDNSEENTQNFGTIFTQALNLEKLEVNLYDNNLYGDARYFLWGIANTQTTLQEFSVNLGSNYSTLMNLTNNRDGLVQILSNNPSLAKVTLGLSNLSIHESLVNDIESALFPYVFDDLTTLNIDLTGSSPITQAEANEIFQDIGYFIGTGLTITF